MLNIKKGGSSKWVFYQEPSEDYFLFEATNKCTGDVKLFNAANDADIDCPILEFTITENSVEDLDNGIVEFKDSGDWTLNLYEQNTPTNKDTSLATLLIKNRLNVI